MASRRPSAGSAEIVTNGTPRRRRSGSAGSPTVGSITITPSSGTRSQMNQSAPGGDTTSAWSRPIATAVAAEISSEKKPNSRELDAELARQRGDRRDQPGATRDERARGGVRPVAQTVGDLADPLARVGVQAALAVEGVGDGRDGDARFAGDVADAHSPRHRAGMLAPWVARQPHEGLPRERPPREHGRGPSRSAATRRPRSPGAPSRGLRPPARRARSRRRRSRRPTPA